MAEGYVRGRRDITPEDVAEECFYELINRNLIQSSNIGEDERNKSCRVHNIFA
jgi:hypothetical protein